MGDWHADGAGRSGAVLERSEQLSVLNRALGRVADSSRGATVLVCGEAGIGKTSLLRLFCGGLGGSVPVLWGVCEPLFAPRPLGPLLDLAEALGGGLAARVADGARPYDVAGALLRELGSRGPSVVVLEDAHWADEATLDVIRLVGRRIERVPALFVVSYRDDQLGRSHPLRMVLGDLPSGDRVARVHLAGLSRDAVTALAGPTGADPRILYERTGGNPFFVTEVLATGTGQIPHTVRDAVLARAGRLSPAARDVLDAAAVIPGRVEPWLLAALTAPAAAKGLDECLGAGMLTMKDGWITFRHEIARLVVEESLPPGLRATLHSSALAALAGQPAPDLARLAHHAEAAWDADAMLRFAPAAAERAAKAGARREAADLYRRALRFAPRSVPEVRAGLLVRFAEEAYHTGMGAEATTALREALETYSSRGDLMRQGDTLRRLARQLGLDGRLDEARAAAHQAASVLERAGPGPELARTYASMSAIYGLREDAEGVRWGTKAIALAEETGCTDALVYALNNVGTIELRHGDPAGRTRLERSRELAEQSGDEVGVARAYLHVALIEVARRNWRFADQYLGRGITYCREHGLETWLAWLTALTAESQLARGRWAEAEETVTKILDASPATFSHSRITGLTVLARLRARRGQPGCWQLLDEAAELSRPVSMTQSLTLIVAARAEAAWLEGAFARMAGEETEQALALERAGVPWFGGEIACWRWRAGLSAGDPGRLAEPYRLEVSGDCLAAAQWWEERDCPYETALALASSGESDALTRARDVLRALGAYPAAAIVHRRLRGLGERGLPRGPRPETLGNPAGLTGREMEVLTLLAGGLSNPQIAARLVLSARTVDHHMSAILHKLGVPNRREAIVEATRLGLVGPR